MIAAAAATMAHAYTRQLYTAFGVGRSSMRSKSFTILAGSGDELRVYEKCWGGFGGVGTRAGWKRG